MCTRLFTLTQLRHHLCLRAGNGELEMTPMTEEANPRVEAGIPFVEALARRMAATMPHSIDLSDLVQDGVIGLIDAAHRFDDSRGIKFETFAERRIRGAMIDALRKDAWPRGVRRVRRELEAAREKLRASLGHEPSLADLAEAIGSDEKRLGKTIVRINTIESTSPFSSAENVDESQLPAVRPDSKPSSRLGKRVCEPTFCAINWSIDTPTLMSAPAVFTGCTPVKNEAADRA